MFLALVYVYPLLTLKICLIYGNPVFTQPEQVHISYSGKPTQMWITWITQDAIASSLPTVEYSSVDEPFLSLSTSGNTTAFNVGEGQVSRTIYTHRVLLKNLVPGKIYLHHVGSAEGWSSVFNFHALSPSKGGYRYALTGDMGNKNAKSLPRLQQEAQRGHFDMLLHVGDIAYDLNTENGKFGDQYMRQMEPIAAYVPYMVAVGNHEACANFSHYVNRYTMPMHAMGANNFYSFDLGLVHFIAFSTEFYFHKNTKLVQNQYRWLEYDLKKAQANRKNVPWIVTMGHRPMYCVDRGGGDCRKYESVIRTGGKNYKEYGLENLFYKYRVDIEFWGHEHSYERTWPIYNYTVFNGTKSPYFEPKAPVHIITGSGGNKEGQDSFEIAPKWNAFATADYGYSTMIVPNKTHLYLEQYSINKAKVIDSFWLRKTRH